MKHRNDLWPVLDLFVQEQRGMLLAGLVLAATTVLAGLALLGLSGWFISATAIAGLSAAALTFDVFAPAAAIRFLALARTASRYGERLTTHDAALSILAGLRERLFRGWAEPGAARALLARPARLLFRLTADIDALDSLYLRVLVPAGAMLATALAAGVALGLMQLWLGAAVAAALIAAGFGLPVFAARAARRPARRRAHALEALRADAIDLIAGQTELAMAGRLAAQRDALASADATLSQADDALDAIETRVTTGFAITGTAVLAGTLIGVGLLADQGVIDTPVAALGLLVALAAAEPFAGLRRGALELGRTVLAVRRIGPRLRPQAPASRPLAPPAGLALRMRAVTARHGGASRPAVHDLTLDISIGERVAVIGTSGAGKSTLLALACGEMAPQSGVVEALGCTLLTQRTELFQDSLRDNLRLAAAAADDDRLWDALAAAGLAEDVRALPRGLDTLLGEGGLGLSGGQGRRLALARLLLRDTPLWLLDEPTEGLDAATARDVLGRLAAHATGRSVIVATHIRREAEIADHLVMIDRGRIVFRAERGEPAFHAALAALRPD
ncbi:thiol reductant ABC exporter subunit CydC [Roseixanthobacter liquoris]|uniref:thiol reductant ABC exporter subunit CydC n=1 Tax=Roseixanthobacter liquoris TaxID=3119921 RepID=UPI00372BD7EF